MMACSLSCGLRDWSVSSTRRTNTPLFFRAHSQLNRAVRAPPMCRYPVGEGAKRTRTMGAAEIAEVIVRRHAPARAVARVPRGIAPRRRRRGPPACRRGGRIHAAPRRQRGGRGHRRGLRAQRRRAAELGTRRGRIRADLHGADETGARARLPRSGPARGGGLGHDDLSRVQVRERQPIESTYRGYRIVSMPLPSSGGFIVSALLNVLEREQPRAGGYRPDRFLHAMIEAEKRLYAVRQRLGDPDFNPGVEERVRRMVAKDFAGDLGRQIGEQATPTAQVVVQQEHGTTHVSAVDEEGNAVALNTTVN